MGMMDKRPYFWGGGTGMQLEFREIRDIDHAELAELVGMPVADFARLVKKATKHVVATNLGIPVGFALVDEHHDAKAPYIVLKKYALERGIEARLVRIFSPDGVKSAMHKR